MATPQNLYFLNLARVCESIAQSERGVLTYPHNKTEVLASCLQAILQTLGGGQPTSTAMPPDIAMGLNDLVQVANQKPNLTWQTFNPVIPTIGQFQAGVVSGMLVDGTTNSITYTNQTGGFAFATNTTGVIVIPNNNYPSNPWLLSAQIISISATGFTFAFPGGPNGSTTSAMYLAWGS
jgi:hypothetical protein